MFILSCLSRFIFCVLMAESICQNRLREVYLFDRHVCCMSCHVSHILSSFSWWLSSWWLTLLSDVKSPFWYTYVCLVYVSNILSLCPGAWVYVCFFWTLKLSVIVFSCHRNEHRINTLVSVEVWFIYYLNCSSQLCDHNEITGFHY